MTGPDLLQDIHGEPLDPIWCAEFRGFFWGEGSLNISMHQPLAKRQPQLNWVGYSYHIQVSIGLRADDGDVLREFQRRLGGTLHQENYRDGSSKTILRWQVSTIRDCIRVGAILANSPTGLPFNKQRQLALWREAAAIKLKYLDQSSRACKQRRSYSQEDSERFRWIWGELKSMRVWSGNS
jgi:hypothetical protein